MTKVSPIWRCGRRFVKTITRFRALSISSGFRRRPASALSSAADHASADDEVIPVPHDGLTGGDRALWRVEDHLGRAIGEHMNGRRRRRMRVTDLRVNTEG